jgi:hypothetical protein
VDDQRAVTAPIRVVFAGGSHLGARILPPTQSLPVLVKRRLAAAGFAAKLEVVLVSGAPERLAGELERKGALPAEVVVWVARNGRVGALPFPVRALAERLRPPSMTVNWSIHEGRPAEVRRMATLRERVRRTGATALSAAFLPLVPLRARSYSAHLSEALIELSGRSTPRLVAVTPIPVMHTNGVAAVARRLFCSSLRSARGGVEIVDSDEVVSGMTPADVFLPGDTGHLSLAALTRIAAAIADSIEGARNSSQGTMASST